MYVRKPQMYVQSEARHQQKPKSHVLMLTWISHQKHGICLEKMIFEQMLMHQKVHLYGSKLILYLHDKQC